MRGLLASQTDAFVAHSTSVKNQVAEMHRLGGSDVLVIRHALYDTYYKDIDKQAAREELGIKESFTVLYFGMIRNYKGVCYLVEAFNRLPQDIGQGCQRCESVRCSYSRGAVQ